MSKEALAKVVQRAISDAGFRRQLNSDPAGALRGFDLSADELSALRTGNAGRLSSLGVDQRMSKAFAIGGAVAATRMAAQSDLTAGGASVIDDTSGIGSRTVIPADPESTLSADIDGGTGGTTGAVRAGDDYKFANRQAPEGASTARVGDDWKFADRAATQGSVAPIEGSPEATAAELGRSGGMAGYPAHGGLAGPSSVESARAAGAESDARWHNDDPDNFLAANANADFSGTTTRSNVTDDPDGFLAANANADLSGSVTRSNVKDDPDGFLAANANADLSGGTTGDGTAFINDSEGYLTSVGYDANAAGTAATDAHDRSGENIVTRISDDDADSSGTSAASEQGPNISS